MTYVYILRSVGRPGRLYTGVTADLNKRLAIHNSGQCAHTSNFSPWEIIFAEQFNNENDALHRERQIKGWSRAKKEALIAGDKQKLKELSKRRNF